VTGLRGRASIAGGALIIAALGGLALPAATTTAPAIAGTTATQGTDVSSFQHPGKQPPGAPINWSDVASSGVYFAGIKASEGAYYPNPYYAGNVTEDYEADAADAVDAGLYVTPYVFANPYNPPSSGNGTAAQQADYAAKVIKASTSPAYSGSHMLPVTLDIEPNPYTGSNSCYGLSQSAMVTWISQFLTEIKKDLLPTSKTPIIYTTADWWDACTGNSTAFSGYPLWLASYGVTNPALPAGWNNYTIWQYGQGTVSGISGSSTDKDELGPVLQVSQAGKAIGPVQLRTLNALVGQKVTYSATGLPPGLHVSSSGQITGTPATGDIAHEYTVSVTPSAGSVPSSMTFTWDVHGTITVTSPGNRTTTAGTPVSLQIGVTDQDGGSYPPAISMSGLPTGLTYNSAGLITGWPTKPGTYTVHVSASDGLYASGSASFTWTISAAGGGYAGTVRQVGGTAKCLDDPASNTANGTKVDLWACNGGSNQKWTVVQDGTIRVLGKCLAESGTTVELWSCSSGYSNQEWLAGTNGALVNAQSRECLYFKGANAANGSKPTMATCGSSNQSGEQWSRVAANVFSGDPGRCLAVSGSTLEVATCANTSVQHWSAAANGTLRLGSECLTEPSGATTGSVLTYGSCSGAATWTLVATPSSGNAIATEIESAATPGLCATASGTEVVLGTCSAGPSSTWHIV
jgi:GH25 family lysozyme M1 (1,4-beta-N-acetylmuramidase)